MPCQITEAIQAKFKGEIQTLEVGLRNCQIDLSAMKSEMLLLLANSARTNLAPITLKEEKRR